METIKGHEIPRETKKDIIYVRMSKTMISKLRTIRNKTGIPVSEVIRESVQRLLKEVDELGSFNVRID